MSASKTAIASLTTGSSLSSWLRSVILFRLFSTTCIINRFSYIQCSSESSIKSSCFEPS
jgi:hypothetical protein